MNQKAEDQGDIRNHIRVPIYNMDEKVMGDIGACRWDVNQQNAQKCFRRHGKLRAGFGVFSGVSHPNSAKSHD